MLVVTHIAWFIRCIAWALGLALPLAHAEQPPVLRIETGLHTAAIRHLAIAPDEQRAVTVSDDKTARLWNLRTRQPIGVLRVPIGPGKRGSLYGAAFNAQGDKVAVAGVAAEPGQNRIYVFDTKSLALSAVMNAVEGDVKHLIWTRDGRFLISSWGATTGQAGGVQFFDRQGKLSASHTFKGPSYGAAISERGLIAVPAFDGHLHFFQNKESGIEDAGRMSLPIADPVTVSFSPDGDRIAVGYNSANADGVVQVDVIDPKERRIVRSFRFPDVSYGKLMQVTWSQDGTKLYAAGSGYRRDREFLIKTIDWPSGSTDEVVVSTNTVTRLAALSGGRLAFVTFEPALGVLDGGRIDRAQAPNTAMVSNARNLKISPDGTIIRWRPSGESTEVTFDLQARRQSRTAPAPSLINANTYSLTRWRTAGWENSTTPSVNGRAIPLATGEISRATALMPDGSAMLLGTSWNLRKLDTSGGELWRIPVDTEVAALNVTQDSRTIVLALVDGTVRWLSSNDGSPLLTLFAGPDGRWVATTPLGHYDASPGAENLVGWQVDQPDGIHTDYFPVARYRERFYRPEVIDKAITMMPPDQALASANQELRDAAATSGSQASQQRARLLTESTSPAQLHKPPVLTLTTVPTVVASSPTTRLDFMALSETPIEKWRVMIDGRPVKPASLVPPRRLDGRAAGYIELTTPKNTSTVQIQAVNRYAESNPVVTEIVRVEVVKESSPSLNVLAIGVARYEDSRFNLMLPSKDAQDIARLFQSQQGSLYKDVRLRTLTDALATRQGILEGLKWLRETATSQDVTVLFIAGHGMKLPGNLYHFLPYDADASRPNDTFITEDQIRDALVSVAGRVLFFVDTCFSGKSIGSVTQIDPTLMANRISAEGGVIVFASSAADQESKEEVDLQNGVFTSALLEGLKGKADFRKEGSVTHKGLDYFVSHRVKQLSGGVQTPVTIVPFGVADYALTKYAARVPKQR